MFGQGNRKRAGARWCARIMALVMVIGMLGPLPAAGAVTLTGDGTYSGGTGTESDPYVISNNEDLETLSAQIGAGTDHTGIFFRLDADGLDRTEPIGTGGKLFNGTFDGNGKTITLNIAGTSSCKALFAGTGSKSIIKNLGVTGLVSGTDYVAGIAGKNAGEIRCCYNAANITGNNPFGDDKAGGIVGENTGVVQDCYNTGVVIGSGNYVGGIAGQNNKTIEFCYNLGNVKSNRSYVGGIVGKSSNGAINNCVSIGSLVAGSSSNSRISYDGYGSGTREGNRARIDMKVGKNGNEIKADGGTPTNGNGEDVSVDNTILISSVFKGWDTSVWLIPNGNLSIGGVLPTLTANSQSPVPTLTQEYLSSNANLSKLIVSNGEPQPSFNKNTIDYDLLVPYVVESIAVTPTTEHTMATVSVNGEEVNSGTPSKAIALKTSQTTVISVAVTAEDGNTKKTYTITVSKEAPAYSLTVENGTITEGGGTTGTYAEGATVDITADTPDDGKEFVKWTSEPAVVFADATASATTFTMPAEHVEIKAVFEPIPVTGVTLDRSEATLYTNAEPRTITLSATVVPDGAFDRSVTWVSNTPAVAEVEDHYHRHHSGRRAYRNLCRHRKRADP